MADLDFFKKVNDRYGHLAGDKVLARFVHYFIENHRPYDKIFRYGGEEFLFCIQADLSQAQEMIDCLRESFSTLDSYIDQKEPINITSSFGITLLDPNLLVEESINRADKAMYSAKLNGRNCIRLENLPWLPVDFEGSLPCQKILVIENKVKFHMVKRSLFLHQK